jgi:hypothetical protein
MARHVPGWRTLDDDERAQLRTDTLELRDHFRWEAARGFTIDETMRLVVSANAALTALGLGVGVYEQVTSVILHPGPVTVTGVRAGPVPGVYTDSPHQLDGEAHHRGPVVLSWQAVRTDTRHPARGLNVVIHEFAHRLDMLDGVTDGTPPLGDAVRTNRWVQVCTREFEALRAADAEDEVLRDYATENPAEFFSVVSEVFFCRPVALREVKSELYAVFADFYAQDPAQRAERG